MAERAAGERARDDVVLLSRLRAGDDRALGVVYDRHADVVYGVARRVIGDAQLARDVTQEVFAFLWQNPDRVDLARGSVRTFLTVLAHRRAVDEVRRAERRGRAENRAVADQAEVVGSHEGGIVDDDAATWRHHRLAAVIDQLPDDQRAALDLAYFHGCTYRQVAERLGIPEGTAKSRLRLALARLRSSLTDDLRAVT